MFGEIAFFSPERTPHGLSAVCGEDCVLLSIDQSTVRQLYYQNPGFGFEIVGLIAEPALGRRGAPARADSPSSRR